MYQVQAVVLQAAALSLLVMSYQIILRSIGSYVGSTLEIINKA